MGWVAITDGGADDCARSGIFGARQGFSGLRALWQPLTTPRLRLRGLEIVNIPAIAAACNDWDVASRLAQVPFPYSLDDARFFIETVVPGQMAWGIEDFASRTLMGVIALSPLDDPRRAELGYWLAAAHWDHGYASEAGAALCAFVRASRCLVALESGYFADNPASGRVQAKLGFTETHRSIRPCRARGVDVPSIETRLAFDQVDQFDQVGDQPDRSSPTAASRSNR